SDAFNLRKLSLRSCEKPQLIVTEAGNRRTRAGGTASGSVINRGLSEGAAGTYDHCNRRHPTEDRRDGGKRARRVSRFHNSSLDPALDHVCLQARAKRVPCRHAGTESAWQPVEFALQGCVEFGPTRQPNTSGSVVRGRRTRRPGL